ncbi:enoyl-CoA hydratase/isomerase [Pusillimonas sp. T7-7]|uniref:enoyl-CoA hydratase/isomerase family protein n=1 Tax=Pusillimonas sp. (strain T7-7) TaxID=1007105 RepID=UPI0002084F58|nr:enoyl-CoA hydratase-related protein [Pusillimonas sp. T7-7]AEC21212.1 enoyl-CoA hydratase/isomerase [Pusillimonas sp. T7-7]
MAAIEYETQGAVAVITINRPDRRNAINREVREGLFNAFQEFEQSNTLRVAILTGAGNSAFCAGMDLVEAAQLQLGVPPQGYFPVLGDNVRITKPVIAAVNGIAVAGGWMFAQMCDLCVASENARFGITEAKVGRGMPWATPLINMIPQRIAMELLLTGQLITAQRAYEVGFVNEVTSPDDLMPRAMALAETIAANAPLTVRAVKQSLMAATEMGRSAALRMADQLFEPVYKSQDAQEGPAAFREKRKPVWLGR